jgi:hypothetical protein
MRARFLAKLLLAALLCLSAAPALAAVDEAISGTRSTNWSGYAALRSAKYTGVGATWVVPIPEKDDDVPLATDATWVGIGGVKKSDLIQAGTQAITKNGKTTYRAWYELLPDYQKPIPLEVRGGDTVKVALSEFSPDLWLLVFDNLTTGAQHNLVLEYDSSRSTAEWIQEMPHLSAGGESIYAPLDRFGTVTFKDAYAVIKGSTKDLEQARAKPITMVSSDGDIVLASPSALDEDAFYVERSDATPQPMKQSSHKASKEPASMIMWTE